jgi:hypothetical protein
MSKKRQFDEESEDDFLNEDELGPVEDSYTEEDPQEEFIEDISVVISEEENENMDIVIEVSDDDIVSDTLEDVAEDEVVEAETDDVVLSKHKVQGKHSLKYDSIFKGKKEDVSEETDNISSFHNDKFEVDRGSLFYSESYDNESYLRQKRVKERVYEILSTKTTLNFLNNRRKPSRVDFNNYYLLLVVELKNDRFTNVELFNELSVYFSDNLFNMFKLLDNKWRNLIILELQDHIGKNQNSKEITNRNIHLGTELEFENADILGEVKLYTGVVVETNYISSLFKVDSYENIYEIHISFITKILNNTKFKHNLNKLDNIDFL